MVKARFIIWALVLIASLVVLGLVIRILSIADVPLSEGLVVRGAAAAGLAAIFARAKRWRLSPRAPRVQAIRAVIAGLALTLFSVSYIGLNASTVAVLSNVDVPLLFILGSAVGVKTSNRTRIIAGVAIASLVFYISGLEPQKNLFFGLSTLAIALVLLCFGYAFVKKSMAEENEAITILTPALAIITYGVGVHFLVTSGLRAAWTPFLFALDALSGLAMFFAYYATMRLYEVADLATAEFPTLLASLFIQPIEYAILGERMEARHASASIAFVVFTYFMIRAQNNGEKSAHA